MLSFFSRTVEAESPTVPVGRDSTSSDSIDAVMEPQLSTSNKENKLRRINKRASAQIKFAKGIQSVTGLDLLPAEDRGGRAVSQCGHCLAVHHRTFFYNVTRKWVAHAQKCPGLHKKLLPAQPAEVEASVTQVRLGGDKHRKNVCDAYTTTYWIYKHKLAFTTGDKLYEVCTFDLIMCALFALLNIISKR
jgi:hypothetical protein